jgi:hypothetical protein
MAMRWVILGVLFVVRLDTECQPRRRGAPGSGNGHVRHDHRVSWNIAIAAASLAR